MPKMRGTPTWFCPVLSRPSISFRTAWTFTASFRWMLWKPVVVSAPVMESLESTSGVKRSITPCPEGPLTRS